ncbi:hypothetical protein I5U03_18935 [Stenotrophomonas maltophilia]|nr:hypothetical protein [Stenotrophomonas maltophilia]
MTHTIRPRCSPTLTRLSKGVRSSLGFTLTEALLALGVVTAATGTMFLFFGQVDAKAKLASETRNLRELSRRIESSFGMVGTFRGVSPTAVVVDGLAPDSQLGAGESVLTNAWGGAVNVQPYTVDRFGDSFSVSYAGLPRQACVDLVAANASGVWDAQVSDVSVIRNTGGQLDVGLLGSTFADKSRVVFVYHSGLLGGEWTGSLLVLPPVPPSIPPPVSPPVGTPVGPVGPVAPSTPVPPPTAPPPRVPPTTPPPTTPPAPPVTVTPPAPPTSPPTTPPRPHRRQAPCRPVRSGARTERSVAPRARWARCSRTAVTTAEPTQTFTKHGRDPRRPAVGPRPAAPAHRALLPKRATWDALPVSLARSASSGPSHARAPARGTPGRKPIPPARLAQRLSHKPKPSGSPLWPLARRARVDRTRGRPSSGGRGLGHTAARPRRGRCQARRSPLGQNGRRRGFVATRPVHAPPTHHLRRFPNTPGDLGIRGETEGTTAGRSSATLPGPWPSFKPPRWHALGNTKRTTPPRLRQSHLA